MDSFAAAGSIFSDLMTRFFEAEREVLSATQELRRQLLAVLKDADLGFRPAEGCLTLGELCREIGEVEYAYIESFRTFRYDFGYRHDAAVSGSVERLAAWYEELDRDLWEVLEGLEEADLARRVDRGGGFTPAATVQFHIYREALLIFYAKADVYLKALGRRVAGDWQSWIGDRADYETAAE